MGGVMKGRFVDTEKGNPRGEMGHACLRDIVGPWILWLRGFKAGHSGSGKGTGVRRFCP